ncbi:phosphatase PAP2 family protein [Actinomadura barringtoniae]|uniref:Phosphatase PAP2 family protein n=1 Tax=Actinomadura barringtoniae TaxID=1427535 RepID=A0A939T8M1_9ACTN|nr:phosphatase PAP2 family protein [Actinomadura barringtoniae]MBO2447055.1 phosphatase PAP2 family protein [Actinomadura barringtoniae]
MQVCVPSRPAATSARITAWARAHPRLRPLRELLLVAVLFTAYKVGRMLAAEHMVEAFHNAVRLWDLERALHLPSEVGVQDWLLQAPAAVRAANVYYEFVHFPATAIFLVWLYLRRHAHYRWARTVLVVLTAAALVVHFVLPLAPPRMLNGLGFVDTGAVYGPGVYGTPEHDHLSNQFAAMPSLHIGWAVLVATGLILATRSRWRWLWAAHPVITTFVVVATANHYWLDGIVAVALLVITIVIVRPPGLKRGTAVSAANGTSAEPAAEKEKAYASRAEEAA